MLERAAEPQITHQGEEHARVTVRRRTGTQAAGAASQSLTRAAASSAVIGLAKTRGCVVMRTKAVRLCRAAPPGEDR